MRLFPLTPAHNPGKSSSNLSAMAVVLCCTVLHCTANRVCSGLLVDVCCPAAPIPQTSAFGLARRSERTASTGSEFDRGDAGNHRYRHWTVSKFTRCSSYWSWQSTGPRQQPCHCTHRSTAVAAIVLLESSVASVCPTQAAPSLRAGVSQATPAYAAFAFFFFCRAPLPKTRD